MHGATREAADLAALYGAHRVELIRLAALLLGDAAEAEDAVQDAFLAVHRKIQTPLRHTCEAPC
jgi:DNA-directed RNA polymerase specialized sigma24 family protein